MSKKCHEEICEECGRPKDLALVMYYELNDLKSQMRLFRDQVKELLDILGLRKKNVTELMTDSIFEPSTVFKHFVKKAVKREEN